MSKNFKHTNPIEIPIEIPSKSHVNPQSFVLFYAPFFFQIRRRRAGRLLDTGGGPANRGGAGQVGHLKGQVAESLV